MTADVVGLLCATGRYDAALAGRFLGVKQEGHVGGRLVEYLSEEQASRRDAVAVEVFGALVAIEELSHGEAARDPFAFLLDLKASPLIDY